MIKYFKELENRKAYYLALVNVEDNGSKEVYDYRIPISFFEKHSEIFKQGDLLVNIFNRFNIDEWFSRNIYNNYENACSASSEFESIKEEIYWILDDYKKININSKDIENYLYLLKRISILYTDLLPHNNEFYLMFNKKIKSALLDLNSIKTIEYEFDKVENIYQPDAWYITPNGFLYNAGKYGHKSRDLAFNYKRIISSICSNSYFENHEISNEYFKIASDMKNRGYITAGQFQLFLNYISQPSYLEKVDGIPVTRDRNINQLVIGIVNAQGCLYKFFEDLCIYTDDPIIEIRKLIEMTNNDIGDILVRCCGFHKVESTQTKTITTSLINYESEFSDYINNGWTIRFIPPIIINKDKKNIEEYDSDFLIIRQLLKK